MGELLDSKHTVPGSNGLDSDEIERLVKKAHPMPRGCCKITKAKVEMKREILRKRLRG